MGKVYKAQHEMLRRPTAIKLLDGHLADRETVDRFEREVQLTSQLTHPNTIQIYDFGRTDDDDFYFAMEYLFGPNLSQLVELIGSLPPARVIHILLQVCGSLKEAHDLGLIHRDIKPANIMLCQRGGWFDVVKVLDFGLVKSFIFRDPNATQKGAVRGTPAYIAPERLSQQAVDHRSDIFSLGAVAYFLLTGEDAFRGDTAQMTLDQVLHAEPTPPFQLVNTEIPRALDDLVMRCLAKAAGDRPPELGVVISELLVMAEDTPWRQEDARVWWEAYAARRADVVHVGAAKRQSGYDPAS
jgi:serine/threonine-protein kinase